MFSGHSPSSSPTPPLVCPIPMHPLNKVPEGPEGDVRSEVVSPPVSLSILEPTDELDQAHKQGDMDHHHYHSHISLLASLRNASMSPLHEDLNEEEGISLGNVDEGIDVQRKSSDMSNCSSESGGGGGGGGGGCGVSATQKDKKQPSRKVSDTSVHSGESGIESPPDKLPFNKDSTPLEESAERKLSSASSVSTEEELATIRHTRSGSVSKAVEMFDTLTRQRKSGLTMVGNPKPPSIKKESEEEVFTSPDWDGGTS